MPLRLRLRQPLRAAVACRRFWPDHALRRRRRRGDGDGLLRVPRLRERQPLRAAALRLALEVPPVRRLRGAALRLRQPFLAAAECRRGAPVQAFLRRRRGLRVVVFARLRLRQPFLDAADRCALVMGLRLRLVVVVFLRAAGRRFAVVRLRATGRRFAVVFFLAGARRLVVDVLRLRAAADFLAARLRLILLRRFLRAAAAAP